MRIPFKFGLLLIASTVHWSPTNGSSSKIVLHIFLIIMIVNAITFLIKSSEICLELFASGIVVCHLCPWHDSNGLQISSTKSEAHQTLELQDPQFHTLQHWCACVLRTGHYFVLLKLQMDNRLNVPWNELNITTRKEHFLLPLHHWRHKWGFSVSSSLSRPALEFSVGVGGRKQCAEWQPR